ncbi:MAG TPA: glycosyltransferase [Gemmataceae bacterium]|nr:glycosyltransferase [Gemmataceae bacterium]
MRVALLSHNAQIHNAVGNHIAEKVRFFQERGAEVRVFVQEMRRLHPELRECTEQAAEARNVGSLWEYLRHADIVFAIYGQYHELLQYLPMLAGTGPRLVFDYLGVTPPSLWHEPKREGLHLSLRRRGYAWCADHVLTISDANRRELLDAIAFPESHTTTLPLAVDTSLFQPNNQDNYLHDRLGINGPILLYVGRLAGNKRVSLLIEALTKLPNAHAVIVGDCKDVYAEEAERCRRVALALGVAQRVHFLGQLNDAELARAYRSAEVFIAPSLHEGFCVPVTEAMASGLPVLVSRSAALPETVGAAGLTFVPDDAGDLAAQVERVLARPVARERTRRVAVVSFRFGPDIVGGAETSLRTMAQALRDADYAVEVFTTCTTAEARWRNDVPAGTTSIGGLTVHCFPIDAHDSIAHGESVRAILEANGNITPEYERHYLQHSIHSAALLDALRQRCDDFDAILVGPYLFGLTADVVRAFTSKTLLVPCFHDEPLARLALWPRLYNSVGGILYHSEPEQQYAQVRLGVNHPNAQVIGTCIRLDRAEPVPSSRPYVVYCGRYSAQKNLPLLLDWMRRYQASHPEQLDLVLVGKGDVALPSEPWLRDRGQVDEETKRSILAGAMALVQLSTQESLSLVVLEAWTQETPVIMHRDCAVLADQIARSAGGNAVSDYDGFAAALERLRCDEPFRQQLGANGRRYVETHYGSAQAYANTLIAAIEQMHQPLATQMRERGVARAHTFARPRWQQRFAEFIEKLLTQPARAHRIELHVEPLRPACRTSAGAGTLLVPVRVRNTGTVAVTPDGPGRGMIRWAIRGAEMRSEVALSDLLLPGGTQMIAVPMTIPETPGEFEIEMWLEGNGMKSSVARMPMFVEATVRPDISGGATVFLDAVQESLPATQALAELPADYIDVTEGHLAPVKRLIKQKLLNNFKHAYVDVLSRQQSQVNGQVVQMIHQLAECCALLDHAIAGLHRRIDGLEAKIEAVSTPVQSAVDV